MNEAYGPGDNPWSPKARPLLYESENHGPGLAGFVLRNSRALIEAAYGAEVRFPRVLEVGAGSGVHSGYVKHGFDEHILTDSSDEMLAQAGLP